MIAVGIDTSYTGTGFAIRTNDGITFKTIVTKPEDWKGDKDETDRINYIRDEILKSIPPNAEVMIEDVFIGGGKMAGASLRLSLLAGSVRSALRDKNIPFTTVPPTAVKKFITGKGQADKELIMMLVFKKYGVETTNNNEADSVVMACMKFENYQIEEKIKKPKKTKKEQA